MNVNTEIRDVGDGRLALVTFDGELAIHTAPAVRTALLKAVAEQPDAIIADVSALRVPDDVVLSLFPAMARHAAAWPGVPLLLAAPNPALAAALDRTATCRFLPVLGSVEQACRERDRAPRQRLTERIEAGSQAIRVARALTAEACNRWGLTRLRDIAELVVTELASNAVRHCGGTIDISISARKRFLHLSIRDRSTAPPVRGHGEGRGLLLVEAFATAWGCTTLTDGKVVWATLRLS
jgi:anti-anti-sigma regulatory factor